MCTVQCSMYNTVKKNTPTLAHYPEQLNAHGLLNIDSERIRPCSRPSVGGPASSDRALVGGACSVRSQLPGLSSSLKTCCVRCAVRDAATTLKLGGGGKRLPGSKVTPTQK